MGDVPWTSYVMMLISLGSCVIGLWLLKDTNGVNAGSP